MPKPRLDQPTIPEPYTNVDSLRATAMATKQLVEALAGQRGTTDDIAVTWGDLLRLGVIKPDQVPSWIGYNYPK